MFPEQSKKKYVFSFLLSPQTSPKGNQGSNCIGGLGSPMPTSLALKPLFLTRPFCLLLCLTEQLTQQNPRQGPNAEEWLKIEHSNYHIKQTRTQVAGRSCFCFQNPNVGSKRRSAHGRDLHQARPGFPTNWPNCSWLG